MSRFIQATFFDVDGVLIDSLPQHLAICRDKAIEFKIELEVPSIEAFRDAVSHGMKVSPMRDFFLAVGFPEADAERAVVDYKSEFAQRYHPPLFEGVNAMLRALRNEGVRIGIVSSNTRENVIPLLADALDAFEPSCLFFYDERLAARPKSWCLTQGAKCLGVVPAACVYVGDQPADLRAAEEAGFQFLGVTYGWGILQGDPRCETVDTIGDIPKRIAEMDTKLSRQ